MVSSSCCRAPRAIRAEDSQLKRRLGRFCWQDFDLGPVPKKNASRYIIYIYIVYIAYIYIQMYTFAYNIWILYILRMYIYISYMYIHLKKYDIYIYSIKILGHWKNLWIFFTLYKHSPLLPTCSKHFFRVCSPRYILKQTLNESLTWRGKKKNENARRTAPGLLTFFGPSTKRCTTHTGRRLQLGWCRVGKLGIKNVRNTKTFCFRAEKKA